MGRLLTLLANPSQAVPQSSFAAGLPQSGLIAVYEMQPGASPYVLYDTSGNNRHGRLGSTTGADTNDPQWTSTGLLFDGVDDYAVIPQSVVDNLHPTKVTAVVVQRPTIIKDQRLLHFNSNGAARVFNIHVAWGAEQSAFDYGSNTGAGRVINIVPGFVNTWTTLTAVADAAQSLQRVYKNATQILNRNAAVDGLALPSTNPFYVGSEAGTTNFFEGDMALIALYNRALTPAEVTQVHDQVVGLMARRQVGIPPMLAFDSFNRPDSTTLGSTEVGGFAWTNSGWQIASNTLRPTSHAAGQSTLLNIGVSDRFKMSFTYTGTGSGSDAIMVRRTDGSNYSRLDMGMNVTWQSVVGGTATTLMTHSPMDLSGKKITITVNGSSITVASEPNGWTETITDNTNLSGTIVGFYCPSNGSSPFIIDDLDIRTI